MFMVRGHGTYVDNEEVIASVAGLVDRVNKLITVKAVRTRWARFHSHSSIRRRIDMFADIIQKLEIWWWAALQKYGAPFF
jgi:hypothetical protein